MQEPGSPPDTTSKGQRHVKKGDFILNIIRSMFSYASILIFLRSTDNCLLGYSLTKPYPTQGRRRSMRSVNKGLTSVAAYANARNQSFFHPDPAK